MQMLRRSSVSRRWAAIAKLTIVVGLLAFILPDAVLAQRRRSLTGNETTVSLSNGVTREDLRRMKSARWLNQHQVSLLVDFIDTETSPYPSDPYDVTIQPNADCYVVFRDEAKTTYDMITATEPPTNDGERNYGVFLSHESPCGVCSNLADLAVYLETPDLTNPVRICGFTSFISGDIALDCLTKDVGFSDPCAAIWFHNTQHTRSQCLALCFLLLFSPNNCPSGIANPCQPNTEEGGACQNTINQQPACDDFQYKSGSQYRLNACLQCDECNSGPLFQKVAGRTRRASGIESGIDRPDIPTINHNYFTTNSRY
ncbi:expressed unknown protein [Seminavis robusta]|uniref:Uncharacterized protein n=1 Tax=Seminavis robusta TaxID=568900 RepID=A0A9N8EKD2_9STRA|nr:expressed unknown protein [Seminavis robusta]|eukprot:Sro1406_g269890.1 n/a (314) ;mRNA; f:12284-13225